jgi:uncharacterized repeat protein (TIGR03803 family)
MTVIFAKKETTMQRPIQDRLSATAFVRAALLSLITLAFVSSGVQAQTFQVLHNFTGVLDGANPQGGLAIDRGGNLYGTTSAGAYHGSGCSSFYGTPGCGTVFELARRGSGWNLNPLYAFRGGNDYGNPGYSVIFGQDGALYGLTSNGPGCSTESVCGTAFRLTPPAVSCPTVPCSWHETVLHVFAGSPDGSLPGSPLITDTAGNLYGVTFFGGNDNVGTAYKLSRAGGSWIENVIYSFSSNQGLGTGFPSGQLALDPAGNLYGTANCNIVLGCFYGAVWQLDQSQGGWNLNSLFQFNGLNGYQPVDVIRDSAGNLYGSTFGGAGNDSGTVYELSPVNGGWNYSLVHDFGSGDLASNLVMDSAGNIYGTDFEYGYGYLFKLTRAGGNWSFTTLHTFNPSDGEFPAGNLVLDGNGNIYGTTEQGGSYGFGTIWEVTP